MEKKIIMLAACLMLTLTASADPITREQAQKKAEQYLLDKGGSRRLAPITNARKLAPSRKRIVAPLANELYYVFSRGDNEGFVIVAGDDEIEGVLGFTDNGDFDYEQLPCNMQYWLDKHAEYIAEIQTKPHAAPRRVSSHSAIEPMVTTKWNQGAPYNDLCPDYWTYGKSVTGCVATAMAQLLYYQRDKSVTETQAAIPAYTARKNDESYGQLHVNGIPANSPIDWDHMLESYGSGATAIQKKAVAQLMLYCGVSVQMDYSNSGSGAYSSDVDDAVNTYFGYGTAAKYAYSGNYNDDTWDALLYNELVQGRPFYLSGSNDEGGHAFVGDGYKDGCFHINWGWGGSSDGYYALNKMNPGSQGIGGSSGGYANGQEAIINFEPADYSTRAMPIANATVKKLCLANWDTDNDGKFTYGEAAAVTDLGDVFKGQAITSFAELYYFTGLTAIADDAFSGCTRLSTVKLPKKLKGIGARAFEGCSSLKECLLPESVTEIGEAAFSGCKKLPELTLPIGITRIEPHCFENCILIKEVALPISVRFIGEAAFAGDTKLTSVTVKNVKPENIELGAGVFEGVSLASATLNVLQGTGSYFQSADQWRDFGTIYEMRTLSQGNFATLEKSKQYYLYNVGTGYYLTHGEAYGTQAVVADTESPMRFEFRQSSSMSGNIYYLYSIDSPNTNRILFRTTNDGNVGSGIKACFIDGPSSKLTANGHPAYWTVELAEGESNVYTIQAAEGTADYAGGQYLGVQTDHASNAAFPTYGTYFDISYEQYPQNCQWMLVEYDGDAELMNTYTSQLANLLEIGKAKRVNISQEQTVYDNFNSTLADIQKACRKLRNKLDFINFQQEEMRTLILSKYDLDANKEISYSEAASVPNFAASLFQSNTHITTLDDLKYFTKLQFIDSQGFMNCRKTLDVTLPNSVITIKDQAFKGCQQLEKITLSSSLEIIGKNAFYNCLSLKEIYLPVPDPKYIQLGANVFYNVKKDECVLYVPYGSRELYANAPEWKEFTNIREMRTVQAADFVTPELQTDYYVYNLGMRRYLNKGEAYNTQSVVAKTGMVYQLRRASGMGENIYYLYSEQTGNSNKILFRTDSDSKVGENVKAIFVDGASSRLTEATRPGWWNMQPVEGLTNVYTFQTPENLSTYVPGEFLGTNIYHETKVTTNTFGTYWDIVYADNPENCQWAFVNVNDVNENEAVFELAEQLKKLIVKAESQEIDVMAERAVYDDIQSSRQQIQAAIRSIREKLHYVPFIDDVAKQQSINAWDEDEDGELSYEEVQAITDLGSIFHGVGTLKSLEDLRYFTGISEIPADAFRTDGQLISVTLPESVTTINSAAFTGCSSLKYLALLNPSQVVSYTTPGLPTRNLTIFVPANLIEAYQADELWGKYTIMEYTGTPTITAGDASRQYGRTNVHLSFTVTGAPINGEPVVSTNTDPTAPVGTYPVTVEPGTVTSADLQFVEGTLTVTPAPVTVTAKSYIRNINEPNPEFEVIYSTLRNREKIEDVLTHEPVIECDATIDSPGGEYEIRVSGAEADNYEFVYVNGKLTINDPVGIHNAKTDKNATELYDLGGRKVVTPQRGVYIKDNHKVVVSQGKK